MLRHINHTRLLRYVGLFTWGLVGFWLVSIVMDPSSIQQGSADGTTLNLVIGRWLAVYLSFGGVYWWITRSLGHQRRTWIDHVLLLVLTGCAIGVSYFSGTGLGSVLLMVVAGLLPWLLPMRVGVAWLVASNLAVIPVFIGAPWNFPPLIALLQSLLYAGFSSFVFVTALVAMQQAQAREEQRRLNAELQATRLLLAESARVNERTRISRELHDLLGHHLTALSLNLEVAGHLTEGRALEHVTQAHTLARLLLTDVREAVSQLRAGGAIDVGVALRSLAENVPGLDIHMDIQEPLSLDDPDRAQVLLRCTQEIITNVARHANARNLWIQLRGERGRILMDAHDDGRGAAQVVIGNGLRGMRERLAEYAGELRIDTRPQAGFRLQVALPVSTAAAIEGIEP